MPTITLEYCTSPLMPTVTQSNEMQYNNNTINCSISASSCAFCIFILHKCGSFQTDAGHSCIQDLKSQKCMSERHSMMDYITAPTF